MRGTADAIMSDGDARAIADNVNRTHPGMASYVEVPLADHLLSVKEGLAADVAATMINWMKERLAK